MAKIEYDELVQLLQEKKIGHLRFVLESDNEQDFLKWCAEHSVSPLLQQALQKHELLSPFGCTR